jgi:hypothetical protein
MKISCIKCGIEITAGCNCGVGYETPGERARRGTKEHPDWSPRSIAIKYDIDETTVRRARKTASENPQAPAANAAPAPENRKHLGRDGKYYPAKRMTAAEKWAADQRANGAPYPEFKIERAKEIGRMPDNTREKYELSLEIIKDNLVKLELMTEYADQMSEELRHLLTDELNGIKKHMATIAKKMFGKDNMSDLNRPLCDVKIPLRKEMN